MPKEKSKNLYHFFQKWAPEVYGDVDTLSGCEARGLEPINTDDEGEEEEEEAEEVEEEKRAEDKENDSQKLNVVNSKSKFWRRRSPLNFLKLVEDHFSTEGMSTDWNVSFNFFMSLITSLFFRFPTPPKSTALRSALALSPVSQYYLTLTAVQSC